MSNKDLFSSTTFLGDRTRFDNYFPLFILVYTCNIYYCLFQLKQLLRNVLDRHALSLQTAKLTRARHYNDDLQHYDRPAPPNVPEWAQVRQDARQVFDTDIEGKFYEVYHI